MNFCIECGLFSYVCPSKIDLRKKVIEAKVLIEQEKEEIHQEQLHRLRYSERKTEKNARLQG